LFPDVVVTLGDGHHLVLHAPGASVATPYVHSLAVTGVSPPAGGNPCAQHRAGRTADPTWTLPWLPASVVSTGGTLAYRLGASPDHAWGTAAATRPPSFATGRIPVVGFSLPSGALTVHVGVPTTVRIGVKAVTAGAPVVQWRASSTGPITLGTTTGSLPPSAAPGRCVSPGPVSQPLSVTATAPGDGTVTLVLRTVTDQALPPVVLDVRAAA
jgi:hypothetical protein